MRKIVVFKTNSINNQIISILYYMHMIYILFVLYITFTTWQWGYISYVNDLNLKIEVLICSLPVKPKGTIILPSVCPSVCPSICLSSRFQFSGLFSAMEEGILLKFDIWVQLVHVPLFKICK
jgi:hypothetical protein